MTTRRRFLQGIASAAVVPLAPRAAQAETPQADAPQPQPTRCPPGPDPRDAVGLPCASCGRPITQADANFERRMRVDPHYPVTGRYLAWTHNGWVCHRCAHPARVQRTVQHVPGIAHRWIVDVDGWLVETARGSLPSVELDNGPR